LKDYEGLFILKPDLEQEEAKDLYSQVQENIKKYGGEITSVEEWGKKRLSYDVKKYRDGIYYLVKFKIDTGEVKHLNNDFRINESVLKVMFSAGGKNG